MKNKKWSLILGIGFMIMIGYLIIDDMNLLVNAHDTYDVIQGEADGDVILKDNKIINLSQLEQFYKTVRREGEANINVAIAVSNAEYKLYELHVSNGKVKLYYDISEDGQGRKSYKIKVYETMKKTYKQDQVTYILVNGQDEQSFLSYKLN